MRLRMQYFYCSVAGRDVLRSLQAGQYRIKVNAAANILGTGVGGEGTRPFSKHRLTGGPTLDGTTHACVHNEHAAIVSAKIIRS